MIGRISSKTIAISCICSLLSSCVDGLPVLDRENLFASQETLSHANTAGNLENGFGQQATGFDSTLQRPQGQPQQTLFSHKLRPNLVDPEDYDNIAAENSRKSNPSQRNPSHFSIDSFSSFSSDLEDEHVDLSVKAPDNYDVDVSSEKITSLEQSSLEIVESAAKAKEDDVDAIQVQKQSTVNLDHNQILISQARKNAMENDPDANHDKSVPLIASDKLDGEHDVKSRDKPTRTEAGNYDTDSVTEVVEETDKKKDDDAFHELDAGGSSAVTVNDVRNRAAELTGKPSVPASKQSGTRQIAIPLIDDFGNRYASLGFSISGGKEYSGKPIKVIQVVPASPAAHAGLHFDDLILEVQGQNVREETQLRTTDLILEAMTTPSSNSLSLVVVASDWNMDSLLNDVSVSQEATLEVQIDLSGSQKIGMSLADFQDGERNVVKVVAIKPGSPAENAHLRNGDNIVSLEKKPITQVSDFHKILNEMEHMNTIFIGVARQSNEYPESDLPIHIPAHSVANQQGITRPDGSQHYDKPQNTAFDNQVKGETTKFSSETSNRVESHHYLHGVTPQEESHSADNFQQDFQQFPNSLNSQNTFDNKKQETITTETDEKKIQSQMDDDRSQPPSNLVQMQSREDELEASYMKRHQQVTSFDSKPHDEENNRSAHESNTGSNILNEASSLEKAKSDFDNSPNHKDGTTDQFNDEIYELGRQQPNQPDTSSLSAQKSERSTLKPPSSEIKFDFETEIVNKQQSANEERVEQNGQEKKAKQEKDRSFESWPENEHSFSDKSSSSDLMATTEYDSVSTKAALLSASRNRINATAQHRQDNLDALQTVDSQIKESQKSESEDIDRDNIGSELESTNNAATSTSDATSTVSEKPRHRETSNFEDEYGKDEDADADADDGAQNDNYSVLADQRSHNVGINSYNQAHMKFEEDRNQYKERVASLQNKFAEGLATMRRNGDNLIPRKMQDGSYSFQSQNRQWEMDVRGNVHEEKQDDTAENSSSNSSGFGFVGILTVMMIIVVISLVFQRKLKSLIFGGSSNHGRTQTYSRRQRA